jgi:hypothetical protein
VDLADCIAVIARHDNFVFHSDDRGRATIVAIAGVPQVNIMLGMALRRARGARGGVGGCVGGPGVGGVEGHGGGGVEGRGGGGVSDLGPEVGLGSTIETDIDQCARCREYGH